MEFFVESPENRLPIELIDSQFQQLSINDFEILGFNAHIQQSIRNISNGNSPPLNWLSGKIIMIAGHVKIGVFAAAAAAAARTFAAARTRPIDQS